MISSDDNNVVVDAESLSALDALGELEQVLSHLRQGVADWRRRALKAEADQTMDGGDSVRLREQLVKLEADNADLHQRVQAARARVAELLNRLRFLEEQVALEEHDS